MGLFVQHSSFWSGELKAIVSGFVIRGCAKRWRKKHHVYGFSRGQPLKESAQFTVQENTVCKFAAFDVFGAPKNNIINPLLPLLPWFHPGMTTST